MRTYTRTRCEGLEVFRRLITVLPSRYNACEVTEDTIIPHRAVVDEFLWYATITTKVTPRVRPFSYVHGDSIKAVLDQFDWEPK